MQVLEAAPQAKEATGKVGDVMTQNVNVVRTNTSIEEAAELMASQDVGHLVVLDGRGHVTGVVSQRDVLKRYFLQEDGAGLLTGANSFHGEIRSLVTTDTPVTVLPDCPLADAASVLAASGMGCLPVVSPDQKLLGLLTPREVLIHVTRGVVKPVEEEFTFFQPRPHTRDRLPAHIRKINGDMVIPLACFDNRDEIQPCATLGFDPGTGRIMVKFVREGKESDGVFQVKRDHENLVIPARSFVAHFELSGKSNVFEVIPQEDKRCLILRPKKSTGAAGDA